MAAASKKQLTVTQFASEIGVHYSTALRLVQCGQVAAVNISSGLRRATYRIPAGEVDRFQKRNRAA